MIVFNTLNDEYRLPVEPPSGSFINRLNSWNFEMNLMQLAMHHNSKCQVLVFLYPRKMYECGFSNILLLKIPQTAEATRQTYLFCGYHSTVHVFIHYNIFCVIFLSEGSTFDFRIMFNVFILESYFIIHHYCRFNCLLFVRRKSVGLKTW